MLGYFTKIPSEAHKPPVVFVVSKESAKVLLFPFKSDAGDDLIECVELAKYDLWLRSNTRLRLILLLLLTSNQPVSDEVWQITYGYSDGGTEKRSLHDNILTLNEALQKDQYEALQRLQKANEVLKVQDAMQALLNLNLENLKALQFKQATEALKIFKR